MATTASTLPSRPTPWNKGKVIGQRPPLKLPAIWAIRTRPQMAGRTRELALFNLAIDSKLRSCDLLPLRVLDVAHGDHVLSRASAIQQKTQQPVRFELSEQTREAIQVWITEAHLGAGDYLFKSRYRGSLHLSTRQYPRIVKSWIRMIGADPQEYGTHSLRRTKATVIYRKTKTWGCPASAWPPQA